MTCRLYGWSLPPPHAGCPRGDPGPLPVLKESTLTFESPTVCIPTIGVTMDKTFGEVAAWDGMATM